jgi:Ca2+-transporting ATPase
MAVAPLPAGELFAVGADAAVDALRSDRASGLTEGEAATRLAAYGPNRPPRARPPGRLRIAARQLADPLVALLLAAVVVSALIGEHAEAAVIAAIVVLNGVLGFVQELGAERAVLALGDAVERSASVVRERRERLVPAAVLVPGDLVVVREGDRVPADARVLAAERLEVDESALTGESVPVGKDAAAVAPRTPLAERASMVFTGTGVTRGRALALVTATGAATELGRIARLAATAKPPPTPLQRRLGRLSRALVLAGVLVTAALTAGMIARGSSFREAFLVGVSVAVAAVPEGLAATVTIALAQGARSMAARGAIVRRLAAVETLGAATVIATDKTGTLTLNQLRVTAVEAVAGRSAGEVLEAGALASTAELLADGRVAGDPVDGAFLLAAFERAGADPRTVPGRRLVRAVPFDPWRKRLTALWEQDGRLRVVVKGAPEAVLDRAPRDDGLRFLARRWAAEGLRVLAVAERAVDADRGDDGLDAELEPLGLVGIRDPLRPAAVDAVRTARSAGIAVAMLTGDHPLTAASIARELGLADEPPLTGAELEALDDDELREQAARRTVYARVTPADKLRLVETLQARGEVVAVTGDGVNDTPAIRRGEVGVAMGRGGTEAAREAADVVLTDDDFATIVAAVREGRRIGDNIRNFVAFLLSANFGEIVLFAIAILAGVGTPLTVVQVLVVNLLTDGLPAVALSRDPAAPDTMLRPPDRLDRLFSRDQAAALGAAGLVVGLAATGAYLAGRELWPGAAQTMAFATIALSELALVYAIRTPRLPAWRGPRNDALTAAVAISAAAVAAALLVEPVRAVLGTEPLGAAALAVVLGLALLPAAAVEAVKAARRG